MGFFTGGAGDNAFGPDEHHGVDGGSNALRKLGLGDKSAERKKQATSNAEDYQNYAGDDKPVYTYPQDLFMGNQVNGVCFFVKIRNNSVAAKNNPGASGLASDRIGAFKSTHSEMATQMNRSSVEQQE